MDDFKFVFKVVLVGDSGVGKTCLARRFVEGLYPSAQGATIGVHCLTKQVTIGEDKVKLQIWDTAGQERFCSITQSYYRSAHAVILIYDITSQPTFDRLDNWLREITNYASDSVVKVLVGNKIDQDDKEVLTHEGEAFADKHLMFFMEVSAKDGIRLETLFKNIAAELRDQAKAKDTSRHENDTLKLSPTISKKGRCAC